MSRVLRYILIGVLGVVLALGIILALLAFVNVRRSFPTVNGEIRPSGLDGPVEVIRDSYGVPHIYAGSQHDLFFAQGYVHAQDRFWQMDFWRHIGSGRLSEMFGESQVDTDRFLRTMGWARIAQQELQVLDQNSLDILQAYAEGVNAYLADHQGSALSLEYAVLKLTNSAYRPEAWEPLHSLTWAKVMAWDLGGNMGSEIERVILMKTLTQEQIEQITPAYPADMPVIVPGFQVSAGGDGSGSAQDMPAYLADATPALQALGRQLDGLTDLLGHRVAGLGSNNWVLAGERTSSGAPILANDPHLAAQMPAIWYQVGLHCTPKGQACPFEVAGFSFAGAPGVIIGHNDRIAWGMTNVEPDVQDLYIEKVNPANPNQYEVNGQWVDMQLAQETIQVAGGEPVAFTTRYTRHGPVVSETYLPEDFSQQAGIDLPESYVVSLRWTALEPGFTFPSIWKLDIAQDWEQFRAALIDFQAPSQNFVYADVDGNIGYQMPGNIPIRVSGDGSLPVPGWTDKQEWSGYIPFEQLPYAYNPPQGYIVTANNAVVGPDYPFLISTEYDLGYRARRIIEMIENAPGPIDLAYVQQMQGDDKDPIAETLIPVLMQVSLATEEQKQARQLFEGWDYQAHMDSPAAALFEVFWKNLLALTFQDDLPEESWPGGGSRWFVVVEQLIEQPDSPWWDIKTTSPVETRDQVFQEAFISALDELITAQGKNPQRWNWGDLHTLTLENQTLGQSGIAPVEAIFNRGPFRTNGGADIVNATGWDAAASYVVRTVPSMRMIADLGNLANSLAIHTTGQSGHAYHRHYVDMTDRWRDIQYNPMLWEKSQIESQAEGRLRLVP